jgi:uncharacterized membrane protein
MNFADIRFWELLIGALAVILSVRFVVSRLYPASPEWFDKIALLGLGLFLLLCVSWVTFVIFLVVAIGTYAGLGWVLRHKEAVRGRYLLVLITLQLLPLFYYKYANFAANQVLGLQIDWLRGLLLEGCAERFHFLPLLREGQFKI